MTTVAPPTFGVRRYFSIASGAAILLAVILMSAAYYYSEVKEQTALTGMRNETLARTYANTLWPEFGEFLLRPGVDPVARRDLEETRLLDRKIRQMAQEVPVIKIKVYNPDGVAVYSSVLREIGEDKSRNSGFVAARDGTLVNELAHKGSMSASEGEIQDVDVVSSYIPIRLQPGGPVIAVFELYADVTDTVARIQTVTLRLLAALALVFLLLYWVLLWIVARADRILRLQYVAIKDNEAHLQAKTAELEREIVERREIEAALRRSEEVAAAASRAKSDFLSGMSHELRTPMNAILGFAQLLDTEPDAPLSESQRKFLHQIMKAGDHLLGLINQVLDLAKIEAGKLSLSIEPVSLQSVFDESLPLVQNMAQQRELKPFKVELHGLSVQADYVRVKQVLLNLLSNAVKYNRTGGYVSVTASAAGDHVRIAVTDTGPGIPSARIGELFQPFSRLGVQSAEVEGTGIGLTLSKLMVEAMGGRIGVDSTPGSGSTFWFELPGLPAAPAAAGVAPPAGVAAAEATVEKAPGRSATVLYVEDNPANLLLMQELVRRMSGVRLISAHNAELGIALAEQERPDLIIMDINLPGMNGFEALQQLRRRAATADIPVMAVSANAMPSDVERGLAAGFAGYHTKPIQLEPFSRAIRDALDGVAA